MVRITVFDSGLGSLSIIKEIQKVCKSEIIYLADQKNYPYGVKSQAHLGSIIQNSIKFLEDKFQPDFIVMASNTPSLMLDITTPKIIDVKPPLQHAKKISKTKQIGILATKSAINSKGLTNYIKKNNFSKSFKIFKINGTNLVDLVESGKFLTNKKFCTKIIKKDLKILNQHKIDVVTLSSTHLPFLKSLLQKEFPHIQFIDPGKIVAQKINSKIKQNKTKRNSLKIYTTGNAKEFQTKLNKINIKNKINFLSILL